MGANIKAIRGRIKSVDSTRHITKAMELVASSKIKRAGVRMEESRFYRSTMQDAMASLASENTIYSRLPSRDLPTLYLIVAGDRGLAGGYNNNIFRSSRATLREGDLVIPIGKRAVDYYMGRSHITLVSSEFLSAEHFRAEEASQIASLAADKYQRGEIGGVSIISTKFVSMLSQQVEWTPLLPLRKTDTKREESAFSATVEFEPSAEEVLAALIPQYMAGVLYSAVMEAFASELAARRSAMDTATKNADEMLEELNLNYNRARQGAITQEITEIVAGANA